MIKSFKIVNFLGEELFLDITRPEDTGFAVTSVSGLTEPKVEIATAPYAAFDGSVVGNTRVESRNIVMGIIFFMDNTAKETIEELRWKCYRYFQLKKELTFYVTNDSGTYWIKGYVESNEINIFSQTEAAQISIICPDPYFTKVVYDPTVYVSQVVPTFQFPVNETANYVMDSINIRKPDGHIYEQKIIGYPEDAGKLIFEDTIQFGYIKSYPETTIDYKGANETGVSIRIEFSGNTSGIRINNTTRNEYMILDSQKIAAISGYDIRSHDIITINTEKGNKKIVLERNGKKYNIIHALTKDSKWIYLQQGPNQFTCTAKYGRNNMTVTIDIVTKVLGV